MTKWSQPRFTVGPSARVLQQLFPREVDALWATDEQRWLMETSPGRYRLMQREDGETYLEDSFKPGQAGTK